MSIYLLSMTDSLCGFQLMVILLPQFSDSWDSRCMHIHRLKSIFKSSEMITSKLSLPPIGQHPYTLLFFQLPFSFGLQGHNHGHTNYSIMNLPLN